MKPLLTKKIKVFAMSSALVLSSLGLQSCTEQEVGTALVVVGAAALVSSGSSNHHRNDNRYRNDERYRCNDRYGYYSCDRYRSPGNRHDRGYDRGYGRHSLDQNQTANVVIESNLSHDKKIQLVSAKYEISIAAADLLITALEKAQQKDFSGVDQLGIAHSDLVNLYNNKGVTRYTRVNLASSLGISFDHSQVVLDRIQSDISQAKEVVAKTM